MAWENLLNPTRAGIAHTLLVKRYGFRSEREVRLVSLDHEAARRDGLFMYRLEVNKIIDKAVLDPPNG